MITKHHLYSLLACWCCILHTQAQISTGRNFVSKTDVLIPGMTTQAQVDSLSAANRVRTISYYDGLGRPVQTVSMQMSPNGKDLIVPVEYDGFGREVKKFLPYADGGTAYGSLRTTAYADESTFYDPSNGAVTGIAKDVNPFVQVFRELSPLSRAIEQGAAGQVWQPGNGHSVRMIWSSNALADSVHRWTIASAPGSLPVTNSLYASGELTILTTIDEAGHSIVEYRDKENKTILKKVQLFSSGLSAHGGWLCTYYIYDDFNQLRFVLQPRAVELINNGTNTWTVTQTIADELAFRYEYDQRHRMVIKKVPGAGEEWMVYDARDRVVMTQDSVLRRQYKWKFILYDDLNRPDTIGQFNDPLHNKDRLYHQNLAAVSVTYPNIYIYVNEIQSINYYDDYSWYTPAPSMALSAASQSKLITSYNAAPDYAVAPVAYMNVRGLATGTKTKVLDTTNTYLFSVPFYDDHGRNVQTQTINYTGGKDTLTTQFNFSGQPLRTLLNHQKNMHTAQHHDVLTKISYDAGQRLKSIWKNIDGAASDQLIDSMQYNELGQLQGKFLGNALDSLLYEYNIRGWITSINKSYLTGAASHYFGMELGYEKTAAVMAGTSYSNPQYNGNISGTIWKGGGDGVGRKYDFSYDNINRLTGAAFMQNTTATTWDSAKVNYSVSNLKYDANGNILSMNQSGLKGLSSGQIDQLVYSYFTNSNRLRRVDDGMNDGLSTLGDFHAGSFKTAGDDYGYDANGNMTRDNNKGIDSITYNQFNLPQQIHMMGKGNITYLYDGLGNKLTKTTTDSLTRRFTTALYMPGGFVYQRSDTIVNPNGGMDTLQFAGHEEGRARWAFHRFVGGTTGYKWEYDFFEKDHLGNTRTVLTHQKDTAQYIATMEAAYRNTENQLFYNLSGYPRTSVSGYPADFTYGNPNDSVARVNGSGPKVGPAIVLKVMRGDKVDLSVQYYYSGTGTNSGNLTASDLINSLASGIISLTGGTHGTFSDLTGGSSPLPMALSSFISSNNTSQSGKPQAFLNWILLDNQFNYVASYPQSGAMPVVSAGTTGGGTLQAPLGFAGIPITKSGYLYIYVSNATPGWNVFFDNLSVRTYAGPLTEETHYYPFGLTMTGISDKALKGNYAENKYRYNKGSELQNKEFSDGNGLELYETPYRGYDPQIGRFWQLDPLTEINESWSAYSFVNDNPISLSDPLGLANDSTGPKPKPNPGANVKPMPEVTVSAKKKGCKTCNAPSPANTAGSAPAGVPALPIISPLAPVPPPAKVVPFVELEPIGAAASTPFLLTLVGVFLPLSAPGEGAHWHPFSLTNPYPGHGNSMDNWDTHLIYEIYYNPPAGASPTLKYGITDLIKRDDQRPEEQIARLQAQYGASVAWKVKLFAPNNSAARAAEQGLVDGHYLIYGYSPIEQILPKPSALKR